MKALDARPSDKVISFETYTAAGAGAWDRFITHAPMATFLHSRRYLSYHAERFQDRSLFLRGEGGDLLGCFPSAQDPIDPRRIVSHPGITYGGLLHQGPLTGERMAGALEEICRYYQKKGYESLIYKAIPRIYPTTPSEDDLYALFRLGAERYRCDLSCAIDFRHRLKPSQRRRRGLKKATQKNVRLETGPKWLGSFWLLLEQNLLEKHGVSPVHTCEEMKQLASWFPENIKLKMAFADGQPAAGLLLFITCQAVHVQYAASSQPGIECRALDWLYEQAINEAQQKGYRYFNFGVSTEKEGQWLNIGLYQFKIEFGASGVIHEFYRIRFNKTQAAGF